ncbi:DUF4004 family protein [Clostridium sartagoforme]|uniref:DUF4004 family protein n=1 Tax=Clostridium sartagoforme TaxID=84031 RepID=A0A4S2DNJ5_9CLOT|nr:MULTISPECIES: DUF4004 family protein [Clostridium]MBS5937252.1 DUF4004 family protein [Clostridium sp.]TGY43675.1 DUF4004 family protein [Clostridium sartagoforme]
MSEELISKKELLDLTGISYGQLYRWKRKDLIPEEWFIKKSVSTGQETFFPREKIIERIDRIIELKDEASLDELAYRFSNTIKDIKITRSYLVNVIREDIIIKFEEIIDVQNVYEENNIFALFLYNKLINLGSLSLLEIKEIVQIANKDYKLIDNKEYELIIKRKLGVCYFYINVDKINLFNDEDSILIAKININELIEEIKKV